LCIFFSKKVKKLVEVFWNQLIDVDSGLLSVDNLFQLFQSH